MKRLPRASAPIIALALSVLAQAPGASAQVASPPVAAPASTSTPAAAGANGNAAVVKLSPFEVKSDKDNSYGALQSNSLSAFSMDLQKMPATAEVFTQTFIKDTQSLTIEDMLVNYSGIVGYSPGDTAAYTESAGDRDGGGGLSIRGFGNGGGIKLDGFFGPPSSTRSASGTTPTFMIERVEVIEGPQSLLYGAIGAGGVINAIYKRANFDSSTGSVRYGLNSLGSKEGDIDYNVGTDKFAVRFAATDQDNATIRQNLGNTTKGYYLQAGFKLPLSTIVRLIHNKYETNAQNGFNPSLTPFLPTTNPLRNDTTQYLAATSQIPAGIFGGNVNWQNVDSFAGWWGDEPSTISNNEFELETTPLPWLSAKVTALYNQYSDWRNTTSLTLQPVGVSGNPYSTPAIQLTNPNLNFQSQRQKAVQLNLLATNDLFNGHAHSQTILGGYLNHIGPSFGSSGISYSYIQADANWNPVIGTGTADYGHILMPNQFIPVANGQIIRYGVFKPGQSRVTLNGVNYILEPRIRQSAAFKGFAIPGSPTNPYGLVPNGSSNLTNTAPGGNFTFNGTFNPGSEEHENYLTFGNYTDWLGGKLTTLAGVSIDKATSMNFGATSTTFLPWSRYNGFELGVIYQALPVLGIYADLGTAATPAGSTNDLYGRPLKTPAAKGVPEIGLKAHTRDQRYSAQLAWDIQTSDQNEIQSTDASYQNAVNPSGINGRFGGLQTNNFVNINRTATALEFTSTAQPAKNWRIRFNLSYLFARVLDDVRYNQLYNDQFHTNGSQVTYGNGTPVFVNGSATTAATAAVVASTAAGAVPLTTTLINTPTSAYYASPDPTSGTITNAALKTILQSGGPAGSVGATQIAANGQIATGVTGLPLAQAQYSFSSPFPGNTVPVFLAGNPTTGFPGWQWNMETDYTLSDGRLKGLGAYFSTSVQYATRAFYTFYPGTGTAGTLQVNESRVLDALPTLANCALGLHYDFKIGRYTMTTSVRVTNLFNHDRFYVLPQVANGTFLQISQRNPPRAFSLWNEVDF